MQKEQLKQNVQENLDVFQKMMEDHEGVKILIAKTNWRARDYYIKVKDFAPYNIRRINQMVKAGI